MSWTRTGTLPSAVYRIRGAAQAQDLRLILNHLVGQIEPRHDPPGPAQGERIALAYCTIAPTIYLRSSPSSYPTSRTRTSRVFKWRCSVTLSWA